MNNLDLSKFKKIHSDKDHSILKHDDGHELRISHKSLPKDKVKELEKIPVKKMAEGGEVDFESKLAANRAKTEADTDSDWKSISDFIAPPSDESFKVASVDPKVTDEAYTGSKPPSRVPIGDVEPRQELPVASPVVQGAEESEIPKVQPTSQGLGANGVPNALMTDDQQQQAVAQDQPQSVVKTSTSKAPVTPQEVSQNMKADDMAWAHDLANGHITPKTYSDLFAKKDTLGKIGMVFGMLLSGAGSALAHQPNALMELMNKEIERDLESQKTSKSNALNFIQLNQQHELQKAQISGMKIENQLKADTLARMQMNRAALHSLVLRVNSLPQGSVERQRAEMTLAQLSQSVDLMNSNLADKAAAMEASYNIGTSGGEGGAFAGPETMIRFRVPENRQKEAYEEVKHAQTVKKIAPDILKAFDDSANNIYAADFVPAMHSAPQKQLKALGNTLVQDVTGSVNQAEFKNFEDNMIPQFGDSKATVARKRETLQKYITAKSAAPITKSYGIDLDKFGSTSHSDLERKPMPKQIMQNGHIYVWDEKAKTYK